MYKVICRNVSLEIKLHTQPGRHKKRIQKLIILSKKKVYYRNPIRNNYMIKTFIAHRINTIEQLQTIPSDYGIECDLRDYQNTIVLYHDPFITSEIRKNIPTLEQYLQHYQHSILILNIKSEGIEWRVIDILRSYNITNFFFLDCSFPMIIKMTQMGIQNIAYRFSEYEDIHTLSHLKGLVKWVWIDVFTCLPLTYETYMELREMGYKLCLVSPELQQQSEKLEEYKTILINQKIFIDAVCTKIFNIPFWMK